MIMRNDKHYLLAHVRLHSSLKNPLFSNWCSSAYLSSNYQQDLVISYETMAPNQNDLSPAVSSVNATVSIAPTLMV